MAIPKIIHQIVRDKNDLDEAFERNSAKIRSENPNWDYRIYDDSEIPGLIERHFGPDMLAYFNKINPIYGAAKADFFRYLIMYRDGGVYLDIKSTINRPLDNVLSDDDVYLLSHWQNGRGQPYEKWGRYRNIDGVSNEYQQWHIVARAQHPFLEAAIAQVKRNIETYSPYFSGVGKMGVMRLTGPIAYTAAISKIVENYDHNYVNIEDYGFQYSIFPISSKKKYEHVKHFKNHYSTIVEPVVRSDGRGRGDSILVEAVTRLRRIATDARGTISDALAR